MRQTNNIFSYQRFYQLNYRYVAFYWKRVVIAFGVLAAIVLITTTVPLLSIPNEQLAKRITTIGFDAALNTCIIFYILGGLLFSSHIFNELHSKEKAFQYLLLPASTIEKFVSAWSITSVVYTLFSIIGLFLLSLLIEVLVVYKTGIWSAFSLFNPLYPQFLRGVIFMIIFQSVFFLGGVYFKSYHFVKTIFCLLLFLLFMMVMGIPILVDFVSYLGTIQHNTSVQLSAAVLYAIGLIIMVLCLGTAYMMLKRKQIS